MALKEPFIVKNILPENLLSSLLKTVDSVKKSNLVSYDDNEYFRKYFTGHAYLKVIHEGIMLEMANKYFEEDLKPSYNFISIYDQGKGTCPLHVDRAPCYRTIDICLDQKKPWPIYLTSDMKEEEDINYIFENVDQIKERGKEYILNQGDALFYSGTNHPHWRNQLDKDNFCNLVFFHFVDSNYDGPLD